MFSSVLFRRIFRHLLVLILGYAAALYLVSAPFIRQAARKVEARSAVNALNSVYALVESQHYALSTYRDSLVAARKRELRNLSLLVEGVLAQHLELAQKGALSEKEAKEASLSYITTVRYGNNDYFWVADYNSVFLAHPDRGLSGSDFSKTRDTRGNPILPPLVDLARQFPQGGYTTYFWRRLGASEPSEKLAYALEFPPWKWILGTGVYLDDVEEELSERKAGLVDKLREVVKGIVIARAASILIFDSNRRIVVDPEADSHNAQALEQVNPVTGNALADDLMAAAKTPDFRLQYRWDRPDDRGAFRHEKISWVRYFEPFGWYIASSVYLEDIDAGAQSLGNRILWMTALLFALSLLASTFFVRRFLAPLRRLWETAHRVEEGDFTAQARVEGDDELAMLGATFNSMVRRLRDNIAKLDENVRSRTAELDEKNAKLKDEIALRSTTEGELKETNEKLTRWVTELERRNREMGILNDFSDMLLACHAPDEAFAVAAESAVKLFPGSSGALFLFDEDRTALSPVSTWGEHASSLAAFAPEDCWAVRRGKLHAVESIDGGQGGTHVLRLSGFGSLCAPLVGQGEVLGIFHVLFPSPGPELTPGQLVRLTRSRESLAITVADHLSLCLANLKLRQRLQDLSVRDPLTGLFNRRYMEESLAREIKNAERANHAVGLIMMDVDRFKNYNDTHGHEAGDKVLRELGRILSEKVRGGDVACRYGGEEFLLILPGATLDVAWERAETIRRTVEQNLAAAGDGKEQDSITISAGVAVFPDHGVEPAALVNAADAAMYRAKALGRNRVEKT